MRDYRGKGWTAATSLVVLTALAAFAAVLVSSSSAAPAVAPNNVGEPSISGTPRVGQVLRSTRGRGPAPHRSRTTFAGSDATDAEHPMHPTVLGSRTRAITRMSFARRDAGFRIRSQVIASNADGQDTATSNPTNVVTAAKPVNTTEPSISGTAKVGSTLQANRGQWAGERRSRTRTSGFAATTRATTAARSRAQTTRATRCATPIRAERFASA